MPRPEDRALAQPQAGCGAPPGSEPDMAQKTQQPEGRARNKACGTKWLSHRERHKRQGQSEETPPRWVCFQCTFQKVLRSGASTRVTPLKARAGYAGASG